MRDLARDTVRSPPLSAIWRSGVRPIANIASLCANLVMTIAKITGMGFLLPLAVGLGGCATPQSSDDRGVPRLTVAELTENPTKWHNMLIEVSGVASLRSEHNRLYGSIYDLCMPTETPSYVVSDYKNADLPIAYDRNGVFRGRFIAYNSGRSSQERIRSVPGRLDDAQLVQWTTGFISACF